MHLCNRTGLHPEVRRERGEADLDAPVLCIPCDLLSVYYSQLRASDPLTATPSTLCLAPSPVKLTSSGRPLMPSVRPSASSGLTGGQSQLLPLLLPFWAHFAPMLKHVPPCEPFLSLWGAYLHCLRGSPLPAIYLQAAWGPRHGGRGVRFCTWPFLLCEVLFVSPACSPLHILPNPVSPGIRSSPVSVLPESSMLVLPSSSSAHLCVSSTR